MAQAHWEEQVSAGGVVCRNRNSSLQVLLIKVRSHPQDSRGDDEQFRWQLPKGLIGDRRNEESREEAALREVREEGGVDAKILSPLEPIRYFYEWNGIKIVKTVYYYLMEYRRGSTDDHDEEVAEARFVPVQEALTMLTYENERKVVRQAYQKYKPF